MTRRVGCCQRSSASTPVVVRDLDVEDGLVAEEELVRGHRAAQLVLERQTALDRLRHVLPEQRVAALAGLLGLGESGGGVAQKVLGVDTRPEGDADR